ncbi:NAD(P)/FAD-dependent oxidoreductase [Kribbella sp. NPDC006257]|uniref:flavin-containing monooxygenase n=1 Tax=Kribbella sp. NPDC006257 TaxID=3156738 RepID=UPI0033A4F77E
MTEQSYDVVVVGAGFAGLYALHKFRDQLGLSVAVVELAGDVGGTWYWNRYPGARCDIESFNYSYSFSEELQQEWVWSERFAGQPEILRYLNHVAARFDLRRDIRFGTRVESATFENDGWTIGTSDGATLRAQFLVSGVGNQSLAKQPDFVGLDDFAGDVYYTSAWPHEGVDFTGKRVAVIGTGASGTQVIPVVAEQAAHLTVFQRTPNYAMPIGNGPLDYELQSQLKSNYAALRARSRSSFSGIPYTQAQPSAVAVSPAERRATFEARWSQGGFKLFLDSYQDLFFDPAASEAVAEFIREKIGERVDDPEVAALLTPTDHLFGTKRPPLETNYYEAFNRPNVTLVDLHKNALQRFTSTGIQTEQGSYEFDAVVLAIGFDAISGPLQQLGIRGREGRALTEHWVEGPRTYLGLGVHGFPNLFLITGPQSPAVLYNGPLAIEDHVDWIADSIEHLRANGLRTIEATAEAESDWIEQTLAIADQTLLPRTDSWYMGANIPGKPRVCMVYLGGAPQYREVCAQVADDNYRGFQLS